MESIAVALSRAESREGPKVESIDRVDRYLPRIDRQRSTRSISGSKDQTQWKPKVIGRPDNLVSQTLGGDEWTRDDSWVGRSKYFWRRQEIRTWLRWLNNVRITVKHTIFVVMNRWVLIKRSTTKEQLWKVMGWLKIILIRMKPAQSS